MEPYALGFLTSLITLVARPVMGRARGELLGHVQTEVWGSLTGLPTGLVGERILGLSLSQDPDFASGVSAALAFHSSGIEGTASRSAVTSQDALSEQAGRETILDLWDHLIGFRMETGAVGVNSD